MIDARFALRWTAIGLACAAILVALAMLLSTWHAQAPAATPRSISYEAFVAGMEMPLDANGAGTQVMSNITLSFRLQPYPARAGVTTTLVLVAMDQAGKLVGDVAPSLRVADAGESDGQEYSMPRQQDGSYVATGMFFPQAGNWRIRVDAYMGDDIPANIITSVQAK
jgi:hypothetical protein